MTEPKSVRVFVDATALELPVGSTAIDAVRALDPSLASSVVDGARIITDSRGLPTAPETPVHAGSIFRIVANRSRSVRDSDEG
jgi:hypothetical protein